MFVITGGSHSGKTTTIEFLRSMGYAVLPETALWVISALNGLYGVEGQIEWRTKNLRYFQKLITDADLLRLNVANSVPDGTPIFWDRGVQDGLVYCQLQNVSPPQELVALSKKVRCKKAFVLDTLDEFDTRRSTGRQSDKERSVLTGKMMLELYFHYADEVIPIPEMTVKDRVNAILEKCSLPIIDSL